MPKILKSVEMRDIPRVIKTIVPVSPVVPDEPMEVKPSSEELRLEAQQLLREAREQARVILAEAGEQAGKILDDAKVQGESIAAQAKEEGFQQGYDSGYRQGKETAAAEMQETLLTAVEKSRQLIAFTERDVRESVMAAESQIVEIVLALTKKVLAREIEENPLVVLPIAQKALEKVRDQEQIVLKVNPADYQLILQARRDLQLILGQEQTLTITPDQAMEAGSCIVESANGTVDARVSTQFAVLEKTLRDLAK